MTPLCPRELNPLAIREVEGHIGYVCDSCQGAWLPTNYLQSIEHGRQFSHDKLLKTLDAQRTAASFLQCPNHCGELQGSRIKGIALDWCPTCQGIWFDPGEIGMLLAHYRRKDGTQAEAIDGFDVADIALSLFDLLP